MAGACVGALANTVPLNALLVEQVEEVLVELACCPCCSPPDMDIDTSTASLDVECKVDGQELECIDDAEAMLLRAPTLPWSCRYT